MRVSSTRLARLTGTLFVVSSLFPIVAAWLPPDLPRWLGIADVIVAALLAASALALAGRTRAMPTEAALAAGFRVVRSVAYVIPILLAVFFLAESRIRWQVLVIGISWRAFLLVMVSPYLGKTSAS